MDINQILQNRNDLVSLLSDEALKTIGNQVGKDFERDKGSRKSWEDRTEEAMKLALQVMEKKNTPWENASNVKFPLLTIACLQFSSRVYPSLITGTDVVHVRTIGDDPTGQKTQRARRVSKHMSYQVLEEDEDWEDEMDRLLISTPIIGCGFKKSFFDPVKRHNVSEFVLPQNLVVNYYTKSLSTASCITQILEYTQNEIEDRVRRGLFREVTLSQPQIRNDNIKTSVDTAQGLTPPAVDADTPYEILEQHRYLDLDEDGYSEPYIVTVLRDTNEVLRIVPRFREQDIEMGVNGKVIINPRNHFTKYSFIPSPDGGFYDLGFGVLLGPSNESVNTIINQLIDAGTLANRGGGFLGRGARIKGGKIRFKMGEYVNINAPGDDIRKNLIPYPAKEPSSVLFQLLGYLVEYAERVSSVTDMMVGKTPGQNTPATTAMAALEEGMKVFTAIYKRIYRGLKNEFKILYKLNQEYLDPESYFTMLDTGQDSQIFQRDYFGDPTDIKPSADPNIASDSQRLTRAEALAQRSAVVPGYNTAMVEKRILEAMNVEGIQEIFPMDDQGNPMIQPPGDPNIEIDRMKVESEAMYKHRKLEGELAVMDAQVIKLETDAMLNLAKAEAEEEGVQIEVYKTQIALLKEKREKLKALAETRNANQQG